jgi:hypothetical protein
MKKVLVAFTLTLSLTGSIFASSAMAVSDGTIQARATEQTRNLANQIGINEYEYIQVKKLNETRLQEIEEALVEYEDQEILALNIRDINRKFEKAVLTMLDARQKKAYYQYKKTHNQTLYTASVR